MSARCRDTFAAYSNTVRPHRAIPQTCGKVERSHQTLKKWLANQPAPASVAELLVGSHAEP